MRKCYVFIPWLAIVASALSGAGARALDLAVETDGLPPRVIEADLTTSKGLPLRFPGDLLAKGKRVLLSFTLTGCTRQCPPSDAVMDAVSLMDAKPGRGGLTLATLTLNPVDDTPERLEAERAFYLSPTRLFLTGHPAEVIAVLDGLGMRGGPGEDHTVRFILLKGDGEAALAREGLTDPAELYAWSMAGS